MRPPTICVITVSYRGAADTCACVRSLLASAVPVRIIVVDTTPNDADLQAALNFAPEVTLIRASENVGFGRGNNLGIDWALKHTSCEFFFLLNNDAVIQTDSIKQLEDAMKVQIEVGIMVPRIAYLSDPEVLWYGGGEVDWRRVSAFTPGINRSATSELAMTERDVTFATGCALFIRRSVLVALRGFDPRFFMYEEDLEFCLRANDKGFRIRYMPSSLILHAVQGSSRTDAADRRDFWSVENPKLTFYAYHVIRNRLLNAHLHVRGRDRITVIVFFPIYLIRRAIPFLLGGRIDAVFAMLHGIADFFRIKRSVSPLETTQ
jgi:GT2 family glycosyltransferase